MGKQVNVGQWGITVKSPNDVTSKKLDLFLRLMEDEDDIDAAVVLLQDAAVRCAKVAGVEITATSL